MNGVSDPVWSKFDSLKAHSSLVLAVSQQFDDASLVGGLANDFLDEFPHKRGPLREVSLRAGDFLSTVSRETPKARIKLNSLASQLEE